MKLQQLRFFRPPVSTTASPGPPGSSISPSHPLAQYYPDLALVPIRPPLIATISLVWLPQNSMSSDTKLLIDYYPPKE